MNRRTFGATSLASLLALWPSLAVDAQSEPTPHGYQIAELDHGRLATIHKGMATPRAAVDDDTLFQVASCSKTVTALAVLTLVRDGKVALDHPANHFLRRWQLPGPRGTSATIAELMSHSAGTTVHGFGGYGPDQDIPDLLDILDGRDPANSEPVRTRAGLFRRFRYSGGGTTVLQALIEDVTGTDFATYAHSEVLSPIGSPRATFAITPAVPFAFGTYEDGRPVAGGFKRHPESAAAGLWATASDLVNVLQAILHALRGERDALIPVALARRMVTPVSGRSGLGVFVLPGGIIAHEGRNYGFDSVMAAEIRTGRIGAAVTNRNGAIASYAQELVPW